MTRTGVDFAFGRPGGKAIKDAGHSFVARYIPYLGDQGKGLTIAEIEDYQSNGLDIAMVFETTGGRMLDGHGAGTADAKLAVRMLDTIGFPVKLPFGFACDFDATASSMPYIERYMRETYEIVGPRNGIYGEHDVVKFIDELGLVTFKWQTYAWSGGVVYPKRSLYQYRNGQMLNGAEVDLNTCEDDSVLWKAQEEDMAEDDLVIVTWCTNQEVRDLNAGKIDRAQAIKAARDRIAEHLAAKDEPYTLSDTLYSHIAAPHGGSGGVPTLVPHHHGPAEAD